MATQFEKKLVKEGNKTDYPKQGDTVTIEYTGWLFDPSAGENKGNQFDSSVGRGDFKTPIGVGRVIAGWDQGVQQMSLGEKSTLVIPAHMGYGDRGFPGHIPPNSTLIFDVYLKGINGNSV
ncbi:uncharacterized protein PV06_05887 [Exophiala oligosperma]|uniref:peptidylprolyl isomerase n=2 Tax=Chaetothyriales TaxID=34395 RepID=A0A0D2DIP4_9EURO|nr:uncharacterized protein PV06_05887 [Exophiala oligosperma]KAJ9627541.1 FK506-binding protein 1B [Knufia peltigerae]KIW42325.1 hypothetical protein PV06_05887 [Exophiala oligosperma]